MYKGKGKGGPGVGRGRGHLLSLLLLVVPGGGVGLGRLFRVVMGVGSGWKRWSLPFHSGGVGEGEMGVGRGGPSHFTKGGDGKECLRVHV